MLRRRPQAGRGRLGHSWRTWFWLGLALFAALRAAAWWLATHSTTPPPVVTSIAVAGWIALTLSATKSLTQARATRRRLAWVKSQCSLDALRKLSWEQFERLIAEFYSSLGYTVDLVGQGGADGGVDIRLHGAGGELVLVQCKHWKSTRVGVAVVREMVGLAVHHGASGIVIVASAGFTADATQFARGKSVDLVDGRQLVQMVRAHRS